MFSSAYEIINSLYLNKIKLFDYLCLKTPVTGSEIFHVALQYLPDLVIKHYNLQLYILITHLQLTDIKGLRNDFSS
jgi:hypothetical protein